MRWIVGDEDTRTKSRILIASLALWIALDVATKLVALALLGDHEVELLGGALSFTLLLNDAMVAAPTLADLESAAVSGGEVLVVVVAMAIGALVAIPFANARRAAWKRVLLILVAVVLPVIVAAELAPALAPADLPYRALMPARIAASSALIVLFLRSVRAPVLVLALATILAGNLGNAINAIYEPRGVVDFVRMPIFGPWVFNVADVAIVGGAILFAVGLVTTAIGSRWRGARAAA